MTTPLETTAVRLTRRATDLHLSLDASLAARLADYYDLLQRWNEKINLTSLGDSDEAIDRLLIEPLAAASRLPRHAALIDVGSGGGSPAIPLSMALEASSLTMIESRGRKAAFLREALRTLGLAGRVETDRAESLAARQDLSGSAGVISVRAVRLTADLSTALLALLAEKGTLAMFSKHSEPIPPGFRAAGVHPLVPSSQSFLHCFTAAK